MTELQANASLLASRLEEILEELPKEGYKAAVVVGLVGRVIELVNKTVEAARKAKCLGEGKGSCLKGGLCLARCGGIYVSETEGKVTIAKYSRNAFTAVIENNKVELKVDDARVIVEPRTLTFGILGGKGFVWDSAQLNDPDDLYSKNYSIKYALRKTGRPVEKSLEAMSMCAASSAIVC